MGRILAVDFGLKRTGLAVTDPLQIIATSLQTLPTGEVIPFLKQYILKENVQEIVIGMPKRMDNSDSEIVPVVKQFIDKLEKEFPGMAISPVDERFTSKIAQRAMIDGGMKKKDRRVKGNVDKISATLILQSFLESRR